MTGGAFAVPSVVCRIWYNTGMSVANDLTREEFIKGSAAVIGASVVVAVPAPLFAASQGEAADAKKRTLGQFFTKGDCWLRPQVRRFIESSKATIAYDPFAGDGSLLNAVKSRVGAIRETKGLDIDETLGWDVNDSLLNIQPVADAVIVTNPPYISNYSARRKRLNASLEKYFRQTEYDDVYLLALDRMLAAQEFVVAIVPETFINSPYRQKARLSSITILEENPFADTDTPVAVVCFDGRQKPYAEIRVYKDSAYACTLKDVEDFRLKPTNSVAMRFNDLDGWLAVRCVDTTNPGDTLRFAFKDEIAYDWEKGIKSSSRLLTLIDISVPVEKRRPLIAECNRLLNDLRRRSHDIVLSPFKGNMKNGVRRRRLDFQTCRAIVEQAYAAVVADRKVVHYQALWEAV